MSTIKQMRQVCQLRTEDRNGKPVLTGHWYNKYFNRYFSIYLTWFFVKLGISANAVTVLMIIANLAAVVLCIPHILWVTTIGLFCIWAAEVLDCVDGEVARWTKKSSVKGLYLDLVSHVLFNPPTEAICAIHLYVWKKEPIYLILAFFTYIAGAAEHGIRKMFQNLRRGFPKEAIEVSSASSNWQGYFRRIFLMGFSSSLDTFPLKLLSAILILISYTGITTPLVAFCWLFAIHISLAMIIRILWHYFLDLPDIPHEKKG